MSASVRAGVDGGKRMAYGWQMRKRVRSTKVAAANVDPKVIEDLDVLARRASLAEQREVKRSDIIRLLLEEGIEAYAISDGERATFRRKGMPKFDPIAQERPARPRLKLHLVEGCIEGENAPLIGDFSVPHGKMRGPCGTRGTRGGSSVDPPPRSEEAA